MGFRRTFLLAAVVAAGGLAMAGWKLFCDRGPNGEAAAAGTRLALQDIPFNGVRAYQYLKQLCAIGPRPSGSPGMARQQKMLAEHFQKLGGQVEFQRFQVRDPRNGAWVPMANIIVRWHLRSTNRILLCAHYDTLPFPLEDPKNPRGTFVGANDSASGVALLMELA
ncbi:MAG: M28 family peptidase, partial [Planctomycetes bacterium]|nr:M28 family peptidase [Planctomycetota bacterium]